MKSICMLWNLMAAMMVVLIAATLLFSLSSIWPVKIELVVAQCDTNNMHCSNVDAISLAAQLGRLDFISTVLAALGTVVVFAGIYGFIRIQHDAKNTAIKAAKEEVTPEFIAQLVEEKLPTYLQEALAARENMTNASEAEANWSENLDDDALPRDTGGHDGRA